MGGWRVRRYRISISTPSAGSLDRQAIVDCIHRYARGVDRADDELLRSAYHPDAVEDHGAYIGDVDGLIPFLAWAHRPFPGYQRYVTNTQRRHRRRRGSRRELLAVRAAAGPMRRA